MSDSIFPVEQDPLISQLYDLIEKEAAKEVPRGYVGASSIGDDCELKLWLQLRHPDKKSPRKAKLILAANDGHRSEDLAASYLRQVPGVALFTHQEVGGEYRQFGFSDLDGMFKGHLDGLIQGIPLAPATMHTWENKCCNEDKFGKLQKAIDKVGSKEALKLWDYKYYCQAIINMDYFDITRNYMTVWMAGSRDLITLRTEQDKPLAKNLRSKAERIIKAKYPPAGLSTNPSWWQCKFCEFKEKCPSINSENKGLYQ